MDINHFFLQVNTATFSHTKNARMIILLIGAVVGFLSGLLGKGGSAIATPALQIFAGINPFAALASPLPATLPTTLSASVVYNREKLVNKRVVTICILAGIPATFFGSFFSDLLGGDMLMVLTAVFVLSLGISFLFTASHPSLTGTPAIPLWKILTVSVSVGFLSGLLANSGGVLFAPLFIRFLKIPVKEAMASSLLVAAGLAIPGTVAHWYFGHINWQVVLLLSVAAIPFSYVGARVAIRLNNALLEKIFGIMLIVFGAFDLWYSLS
jgi:hypothetical protein